ncbi:Hypothetical Protein FCC1311_067282 [Hondaea fermentalgiana]|uniref:Uncharacterized protein n=1 Tax=Hondaea fermentalgiana TaxID=2315210 RepID=A0A2R5GL92_9STRA|nr:Hypothetical Protein FCC1311_067282 [Hondaea fermentalgiana]|eukprot:GBG30508.1 Hypothetical Protein FCC1311_067282 [Hondaea fermentalgiana]
MYAATGTKAERGSMGMEMHDEDLLHPSVIPDGMAGEESGYVRNPNLNLPELSYKAVFEMLSENDNPMTPEPGLPPSHSDIEPIMEESLSTSDNEPFIFTEQGVLDGQMDHDDLASVSPPPPPPLSPSMVVYHTHSNASPPGSLSNNDAPMTCEAGLPPSHSEIESSIEESLLTSHNEPPIFTGQEFIEGQIDHDDFASGSPPPPPPLFPSMVVYHTDSNASPPGSPSDQATVPSSPASEPDYVYRTPSTPSSQKQNRLKLSLDCALALFRTASLMRMSRSDLRDFTASFEAYKQFPCTAGTTWKAQDYRQKLKHALGERQVRTVRQNQMIRSFRDEAAVLAELQKSFPERTESGFDFQHIAAHLWKAIDISRAEAHRKRKSFVAPKFKSGLTWGGLAGESLVKLLVEEHWQADLNSSVEKSWWFQKKAQVELLVFSHCKCTNCSLWHLDINSASPGMLELRFTRLRSEIYHAILTSHKYQEPMSRLKRDFPQLEAVDQDILEEMHMHLHDTEECPTCQRRSTRMHRAAAQLESEESDEDSDEEDDDDNVGKAPKGIDGLVLAKVLMPLSADHYDDGDEGVETDDEEEEETNVENGVAQDTDVAALALDRLTLSSS